MFFKRTLPVLIALVMGLIGIFYNYSPHALTKKFVGNILTWDQIIYAFAGLLGIYGLLSMHITKIKRKTEGWGYSIFTILGFIIMILAAVYNGGKYFWNPQEEGEAVEWLYNNVFNPAQATMFATLAFFIASAAFRSFRAKTIEATVLLIAGVIVMFGQVPVAALISHYIPDTAQWLLSVPNMAVKRAIFFGICLGGISTSLRIIFGIERTYLGGE